MTEKRHESRSQTGKIRTFKYRCVDCGKVNKSREEAPDCMVHCERCGFSTVQTCEGVEVR